jgi:predicted nucleic acid-binding protein
VSRAILDTSVLIAREQGRAISEPLPDDAAISVVSLAELELGVLVARDARARSRGLRTLTEIRASVGALAINEQTASAYAELAALVLSAGRKPRVHDTWIAAAALANDAAVWTQDADFSDFADAVPVVRV